LADIRYIVECDATGALKSIKEVDATINKAAATSAKAGGTGGPFGSLFAQFTAGTLAASALHKGIGAIKGVIESSIRGAIEAEQSENNLNAALEITGRTVAGNIQHYKKFAAEQMRYTTYTDDQIMASQALLLQLTNLDQKGLDRATKGAMGLATTMGIDLKSATMMVTKAMEGNYGALGRVGIQVDKNLTAEQKQASLLDQLEKLYGRSTAEVNTFGGALKQLVNNWGEIKEAAGGAVIETEGLGTAITGLNKAISAFVASGGLKTWLDQIMRSSPAFRVFTDGLKLMTIVLETESAKAEHASKVNQGLGISIDILGQVFGKASPMLKAFGIDFKAVMDIFTIAPAKINETGTKTHILTEEEKKAAEAKRKLADAAQDVINKYNPLRAAIMEITKEKQTLTKAEQAGAITWEEYRQGIVACDEALRNIGDTIETDTVPALTTLEKMMRTAMAEIDKSADFTADNMASDLDKIVGSWKEGGEKTVETTRSFMDEVSTIVADSMRNIASSVVGLFNLQGLLGAAPKTMTFDSSYYDQMIAAAEAAYGRERSLIESSNDARLGAAQRAFSAEELLRTRAEQDQDRARERQYAAQDVAYARQYENQKRAIQNSKMTEAQKQEALRALEIKYEDAKVAREQRREDAKVARERRREDARLKRELAQEKKLEEIRAAGLQKLLDLQTKHQTDLDAIRTAEDAARQAQADKEESRQKSLWFKVKGIFATAVQEMATIWLTRFISKLILGSIDAGAAIAKNVGSAVSNIASSAGQAASGFLSSLGSLGSIVTAITSVIQLLKGPQKQTDVTYWLKLLWELAQNTYNFYVGALTWKLDAIYRTIDGAMKPTLWKISTASQLSKDYLKSCREYLKTANTYLRSMDATLKTLKGGQAGAISTQTELMVVHGTPTNPEFVLRGSQIGAFAAAGPAGGSRTINLLMPIYLGGEKIDERMYRVANERVEWLDSEYQRSNRRIPNRTVGG
jgi:hypothetical protein